MTVSGEWFSDIQAPAECCKHVLLGHGSQCAVSRPLLARFEGIEVHNEALEDELVVYGKGP
jgi:hypothetical protein